MTHTNQSARQVTGVSPRHAFTFNGLDETLVVDNVVGVDITAVRSNAGDYVVTHNLGNTAYVVSVTAEMTVGEELICNIISRSGTTFGIHCEIDDGTDTDAKFIHGMIYN